ncbi:hypothetical protein P43SY_002372 [Pythium insidiosum]|uniref:EF-hand domain-containing protein n=1 Tax=Pythium insidiosum TaxID=114742 RepID=A0AAD5LQB7_PYTIN|nr:hypothetical protein P43SY_002372 [Pythium insidiosum]
MVSPSKSRAGATSGLRGVVSRKGVSQRRGRADRKYEVPTEAERREIKRVTEHVRRSLAPFRERFSSGSAVPLASEAAIPAMSTIQAFVQRLDGDQDVLVSDFRKCLYALGVAADDAALLLDTLDLDGTGVISGAEFARLFFPVAGFSPKTQRQRQKETDASENNKTGNDRDGSMMSGKDAQRVREFHQRVIERVMVRYSSIKDAFRQCEGYSGAGGLMPVEEEPVTAEELESVLEIERQLAERILRNTRDLRAAFRKFDANGNGKLEYKEFLDELKKRLLESILSTHATVQSAFRKFDTNKQGSLDFEQFRLLAASYGLRDDEAEVLMTALDQDNSGFIDYEEFLSQLIVETG